MTKIELLVEFLHEFSVQSWYECNVLHLQQRRRVENYESCSKNPQQMKHPVCSPNECVSLDALEGVWKVRRHRDSYAINNGKHSVVINCDKNMWKRRGGIKIGESMCRKEKSAVFPICSLRIDQGKREMIYKAHGKMTKIGLVWSWMYARIALVMEGTLLLHCADRVATFLSYFLCNICLRKHPVYPGKWKYLLGLWARKRPTSPSLRLKFALFDSSK